jgi:hypothetical protein
MKTVIIRIDYISNGNKLYQVGSFPLRGRNAEQVALDWWKQIKREMSYFAELEIITANGENITQMVKDLEENERKNIEDNLDLPF